jgi:hypothetical protein
VSEFEHIIQSAIGDECNSEKIAMEMFSIIKSLPQATGYGPEYLWVPSRTVTVVATNHWAAVILGHITF